MTDIKDVLKAIYSDAFVTMDAEIDELADEVGYKTFSDAVKKHKEELSRLGGSICDFYKFSGSDSDTWDSWTDRISEQAMELFSSIKRTALEMKADKDKEGKE